MCRTLYPTCSIVVEVSFVSKDELTLHEVCVVDRFDCLTLVLGHATLDQKLVFGEPDSPIPARRFSLGLLLRRLLGRLSLFVRVAAVPESAHEDSTHHGAAALEGLGHTSIDCLVLEGFVGREDHRNFFAV